MISKKFGGGYSMFKFFLLSIFAFLLFTPKSHALIDYTVLDSVTDSLTFIDDFNWSYVDATNVLTYAPDLSFAYQGLLSTYDFRLYVCPDKETEDYTSSDCSIVDIVDELTDITNKRITLTFSNDEIDANKKSFLVVLMEDGDLPSSTAANFMFYTKRVIDTTAEPATFSAPPEVNVAPVGTSFTRTVEEGETLSISYHHFSVVGDTSSAKIVTDKNFYDTSFTGQIVTAPSHGAIVYFPSGDRPQSGIGYIHDGSETLADTFSFTVTDDEGARSNIITATINITPNADPVGVDFERTIDNGGFVDIYLNENSIVGDASSAKIVTDPDDTGFGFNFVTAPSHGTVTHIPPSASPSGAIRYRHDGSNTISDTFSFRVSDDPVEQSNIITATININPPANTVIFANSPIDITEGEEFIFNPILSDTSNLVDGLEFSKTSSTPFSLLKLQNDRVVIDPTLDTANEYIFSSTGGADEAIVPYNIFDRHTDPRTAISGNFTISALDSSNAVLGSKVFSLTGTKKNLPTSITTQSPIRLELETEVDFNIEFTNPDGDEISSSDISITGAPSWLTVDKTRDAPTVPTGTINFTGTVPATFENIEMTVRVLDPSQSDDEEVDYFVEKVFRIRSTESGTLDFDNNGETDTIDANFLYTYILSKDNDSLSTLLTSLVKGGQGGTEDINAAIATTEDQLGPLGNLDFDDNGESDTIDANFLYTYILSKENDSLSTLLTSLVKGGIGTTEDINRAKAKVDNFLIE